MFDKQLLEKHFTTYDYTKPEENKRCSLRSGKQQQQKVRKNLVYPSASL